MVFKADFVTARIWDGTLFCLGRDDFPIISTESFAAPAFE